MIISHKHKLVFLDVARTGSNTISTILNEYADIRSLRIQHTNNEFPFYNHIPALPLQQIFEKRGWDWSAYKRFCIVRNPWDRLASSYHYHLSVISRKFSESKKHRSKLTWKTHCRKFIEEKCCNELIWKVKQLRGLKSRFKNYIIQIDPENRSFLPLESFIGDSNRKPLVEDILMFENLTEELPEYLGKAGIHIVPGDIPHVNASRNRKDYRKYYDEETKRIVGELYAYEIDRFGYRF